MSCCTWTHPEETAAGGLLLSQAPCGWSPQDFANRMLLVVSQVQTILRIMAILRNALSPSLQTQQHLFR
jgi:hypothetical protein